VTTPPPAAAPPPPPSDYTAQGDFRINTDGTYELRNVRTPGSLTKEGTGRLDLLEYNRFDAGTVISAGSVHAMGDLRSNVTIQSGAELVGYATIIGNIQNAGTFSVAACGPWDYCSYVEVRGSYTQTQDGKLRVRLGSALASPRR
jgi:hypothetical protein